MNWPKTISIFSSIILFVSLSFIGQSQSPQLIFRHLTADDGLAQNCAQAIIQDQKGFIWFGTQDGLCRYDGYDFKTYRHESGNPNSLSNNFIWDLYEDKDGIIWIATFGGGLNSFDPKTEKFTHYKGITDNENTLSSNRLFAITEESEGILWLGTNDGICRLDKATGEVQQFLCSKANNDKTDGNYIGTIALGRSNEIWAQSDSGLTLINTDDFSIQFFSKTLFSGNYDLGFIYTITYFNDKLYVASSTGVFELDLINRKDRLLLSTDSISTTRGKAYFTELLPQPNGRFWIGSNTGIISFDSNSGEHVYYTHNASDPNSLIHNTIKSLYRSKDGLLWIGTNTGISVLYKEKPDFGIIRDAPDAEVKAHKSMDAVLVDRNDFLWIGSSEGLRIINRETNEMTIFFKDRKKGDLSSDYILSLLEDREGNIWVGTRAGGVYRVSNNRHKNPKEYFFEAIKPENTDLSSVSVHYIFEDQEGIIWLGTGGNGLLRYNPKINKLKTYFQGETGEKPSHPYVYCILEDSHGNMWLGTATGGLNLFNKETEQFIYIQNSPENQMSLSNNMVLALMEDRDHRLWVSTASGLNRSVYTLKEKLFPKFSQLDLAGEALFERFGIKDGLPNEVIYGTLQDNNGNIWMSTNKGLACIDPIEGKTLKTYESGDGLQNNEFNQNGYYKSKTGELFFAGLNGLNHFHPDSLKGNPYQPPVVITNFKLFNDPVLVGNKGEHLLALDKRIEYLDELNLSYTHDVLTFEFAALSYTDPSKNQYHYMLEGFDKDWIDAGNSRSATYTNLDAGDYVFKVIASNNDEVWNKEGASIILHIPPPPWLSWYAYLLYALAFVGFIYLYIRFRVKKATQELEIKTQIEKAKTEERESFRKKSSQDFHDEAGNKITKINLFTELARADTNSKKELKEYLDKIEHNSKELSAGMRDFIWAMDPAKDTLFDTIMRLKDFGDSMFTDVGVNFNIKGLSSSFNNIRLSMDLRRAIVQVFKEAMNNAAKYAKADEIILLVSLENKQLNIELQDNGKGFYSEDPANKKGYGQVIMKERADKAGGKISISSQIGQGTKVAFTCNIPHMGN